MLEQEGKREQEQQQRKKEQAERDLRDLMDTIEGRGPNSCPMSL